MSANEISTARTLLSSSTGEWRDDMQHRVAKRGHGVAGDRLLLCVIQEAMGTVLKTRP